MREGDKIHKTGTVTKDLPFALQGASDMHLSVGLERKLLFPQDVAATTLQQDMVLLSRSTKIIIVVELTVPRPDRPATSHPIKKAKYQDLRDKAVFKGWQVPQ